MEHAKLWKRILHEGIWSAGRNSDFLAMFQRMIIKATIIVDGREWDHKNQLNLSTMKGLRLPFDPCWFEGALFEGNLWGAFVKLDRDRAEIANEIRWQKNEKYFATIRAACVRGMPGVIPGVVGQFACPIDKLGNPTNEQFQIGVSSDVIKILIGTDAKSLEYLIGGIGCLLCENLMFLGCKNVSLLPTGIVPKQAKIASKRHGNDPDYYRYHTLVVRPAGAKSDTPFQEIGMMPRHVCRGHFSEYGPEFNKGLLFGKYSGRFFIPPHLKGDKKNGVVEKDYMVTQ